MPLYSYVCQVCGLKFDEFTTVDKRHNIEHCNQPAIKCISNISNMVDSKYRDLRGTPIYFPKVGSHFDRALQRTFHSKKEKAQYLKEHNLIMDGSYTEKKIKNQTVRKSEKGIPIGIE